jgi:hypothetical protein
VICDRPSTPQGNHASQARRCQTRGPEGSPRLRGDACFSHNRLTEIYSLCAGASARPVDRWAVVPSPAGTVHQDMKRRVKSNFAVLAGREKLSNGCLPRQAPPGYFGSHCPIAHLFPKRCPGCPRFQTFRCLSSPAGRTTTKCEVVKGVDRQWTPSPTCRRTL